MDLRSLRYFIAVAEERHFGRAAARLHITQPPLSRAIRQLETDLGALLLHRSPAGVTLTGAGTALYEEARALLEHAEHARARVTAAAGTATFTIGILSDSAEDTNSALADAFRSRNPKVVVQVRQADLTDPTTGLRAGLADVALTRTPFDSTGISTRVLRSDPVGVVLRADDPLAGRTPCSWTTSAAGRGSNSPREPIHCGGRTGAAPGPASRLATDRWSAPSPNASRAPCGPARSA